MNFSRTARILLEYFRLLEGNAIEGYMMAYQILTLELNMPALVVDFSISCCCGGGGGGSAKRERE